MPCIGDLLFCPETCTFQYEVRNVHTSMFGTETYEFCLSIAEPNIEPLCASLSCWR